MRTPLHDKERLHVVVVGSGIAGLVCALEASRLHTVTVLTKSAISESNTRYAQGGIAAALFPDDSPEEHIADTLFAGAGLSHPEVVRILCEEGPERVLDLVRLGAQFDRKDGEFVRGLEAAHSRARIVHAGGDATGAEVERALVKAIRRSGVTVLENTFLSDLLADGGSVSGVRILRNGRLSEIYADRVVLASGGAGQLYLHTTNPAVTTGDGVAAALRAGAVVSDLEFYQFHPTALAARGHFLISEAVRGEGAVLRDSAGKRFMPDVDPLAELAPRDVVARGIAAQMAAQGGAPVTLDATMLGGEFLARRFPSISAECTRQGIDWSKEGVPITPAAHYWMGGVLTDADGRTSIRGLYAIGEVANTGVHGANRLASNSLLESAVFAHRCACALEEDWVELDVESRPLPESRDLEDLRPVSAADAVPFSRTALQSLLWNDVGLIRSANSLRNALAVLGRWHAPTGDTVQAREDANLLELGRAMAWSALSREESRGAHFRSDYPQPDPRLATPLRWRASSFASYSAPQALLGGVSAC